MLELGFIFSEALKNFLRKNYSYLLVMVFMSLAVTSNATIYYVSISGNDSNSGTSLESAWKSLAKVNSITPAPGDQILFKRGETWVGTLTVKASGTSGSPVVYGAYGTGEKPKIYGSEEITGWTVHSGNIYKATTGSVITQLFADDSRLKVSRYPNSGYLFINSVQGSTQFTCNGLNAAIDYTGAKWYGRTAVYFTPTQTVTSSSSTTITLDAAPTGDLGVNEGFVLINKLEFLDEAGEWYFDESTNTIYVWMPNGGSPANFTMRGSVHDQGIYASSKDYILIQNLDILQQSKTGIYLNSCDQVTIDNNNISYPEEYGIYDNSHSNNNTITDNTVTGANHFGLYLRMNNSTISDNNVLKSALFDNIGITGNGNYALGGGVFIGGISGGNTVKYNRVVETGYHGIYFARPNNIIQYNFIKDACLLKGDGGGIYTSYRTSPGPNGSEVINNIVLNVTGRRYGYTASRAYGEGIYIDESAEDVLVENNTVAYCSNSGIFLHDNAGTTVRNNTILDGRYGIQTNKEHGSNIISNNTIYALDEDTYEPNKLLVKRNSANAAFNNNKYVSHYNSAKVFKDGGTYYDFNTWKSQTAQDANSSIDVSSLNSGETEELFYNDTKQTKSINLGTTVCRDIDGNSVSGTISLDPFTSIILIKSTSTGSSNNTPVINNQSFSIEGGLQTEDFVGQVVASDSDVGQSLTYSIQQGADGDMFSIDPVTGIISAATLIEATTNVTLDFVVEVTDNATDPLTATAIITVNISASTTSTTPDVTAPTLSSFVIPSTSSSLTVSISSFVAEDNQSVTGYIVTESSDVPSLTDSGWESDVPTSYVFTSEGSKTLYAWAKDAAGNVSDMLSASVVVALPDMSSTYSEYLFEEGSGDIVYDTRGSNDGTIKNNEARVDGIRGGGLNLTGVGYVFLGQSFGDNVQDGVTLSAWIKPTAQTGDYQGVIMHGGPVDDSFALYIKPDTKGIGFKTTGTTSEWSSVDDVNVLWDGNWHHLVVTYNGTEKVIYVDGNVVINYTATGSIISGSGYNLYLGAGRDIASPTLLYNGLIDEVRIYNYGLTQTEVDEIYNLVNTTTSSTVYTTEDIFICEGSLYEGWAIAGQYQRTLTSSTGGDSIVTTNLTVNPVYNITENIVITEGENYLGNTTSGEYERVLTSISGCDSVVTTILYVVPSISVIEEISICEGEDYMGWTKSGEYQRTLKSTSDADSIITTFLTVYPVYNISENIYIADGENYMGWTNSGIYTRSLTTTYGCDSIITTYLQVAESTSSHFQTVWDGENGFNHMSFNIINATQLGTPLDAGDEISVFDGDKCVGNVVLSSSIDPDLPESYVQIIVSQDDGSGNGFTDGNEISFKIWDSSEETEKAINMVLYKDDLEEWETSGTFIANGTSVVEIGIGVTSQSISLTRGWNIFSSYLSPEDPGMDAVQQLLVESSKLVKVQDELGNTYEKWNSKVGWINNIGDLKTTEGYKIRVKADCVLEITGQQASLPMDIELKSGWNIISFPYITEINALDVVQNLIDAGLLEKVQDQSGSAIEYWDSLSDWHNGIGSFKPGEGYMVKVLGDCILTINGIYTKAGEIAEANQPTVFFSPDFDGNGTNHMNINIIDLSSTGLSVGDEIAAFDGEICVGTVKLNQAHFNNDVVSINASLNEEGMDNGFTNGNSIQLSVWSEYSNEEIQLTPEVVKGDLTYNKFSSVFLKLDNSIENQDFIEFEMNIYPNPASDKVNISFSELPENGSKIILVDLTGKQLFIKEIESTLETIDLQSYPNGIYLVKTVIGQNYQVKKLIKN